MEQSDFERYVNQYMQGYSQDCRSTSFDICYGYFQTHKGEVLKNDIERACLVLWSYLASYGMLRASNKVVLYKNPFYLKGLIEYIADNDLSDIDVSDYDNNNRLGEIISAYKSISKQLCFKYGGKEFNPSITFVTKVMLGVYSCVPAFDTYFCKFLRSDLGINHINIWESLPRIKEYFNNIEKLDKKTFCYGTTNNVSLPVKFARQIDMYGWEKGKEKLEGDKEKKIMPTP